MVRSVHIKMAICAGLVIFLGAPDPAFSQSTVTSSKCPGESGYYYTNYRSKRNPRRGGFVGNGANVGDHVFIAKTAAVCGSASVLESARVYGNAVIGGEAEVTGNARVYGDARISGSAVIGGKAKVSGNARVSGSAIVEGIAWMRGYYRTGKGHYSKGTYQAEKPAYVRRQEQQAANAKSRREQAVKDKKQREEHKRRAKSNLKDVGRKIARGDYRVENRRRQTILYSNWSLSSISAPCRLTLQRHSGEITKRSKKRISSRYKDVSINLRTLSGKRMSDWGRKPYCAVDRGRETYYFCYSSASDLRSVFNEINNHVRKYCTRRSR